ncbi:MAG: ArsA family ATPase [Myxococcales bacterium]|nr:ArsA family ATPase [Myxococcales bacterium]
MLAQARCVVCVGQGGVGKTSTSAALAIEAARQGRRTAVLTIDPARRLANALGLPEIGNIEREVPKAAFEAAGLEAPAGKLTALMLDIKQAWDEVVDSYHPDPERKQRLLQNRLYEAMSSALAGSQEYMAMEKLYQLSTRTEDRLDVIILDTPPANHAVDFLEAPSRMLDALDNDATRWLLEPYERRRGLASRIFDAGSGLFIRTISRFTGTELLEDLAELLSGFQGMFQGFRDRAAAVRTILAAADTSFVVVSTPSESGLVDARAFRDRLRERQLRVGSVVLNRATPAPFLAGEAPAPEALARALASTPELAARLEALAMERAEEALAHREAAEELALETEGCAVVAVPQLPRDVHDLEGLERLRQGLFAPPPQR